MFQEVTQAFLLIFIAEMGDKTQILAMAFATQYPIRKVLAGIFIGSLLNHGIAVVLGKGLAGLVPLNTVQMIAGFLFVAFALWTLQSEDEEDHQKSKPITFGPVITVGLAFFMGELGDKTQLTAITLASEAMYPVMILCGTVLGMVVTGALGILVGRKLGANIPEFTIKLVASGVFMAFGLTKIYQTLPIKDMNPWVVVTFLSSILLVAGYLIRKMLIMRARGHQTAYQAQAEALHDYYHHVLKDLDEICLSPDFCGTCEGQQCRVGYTKDFVSQQLGQNTSGSDKQHTPFTTRVEKVFDKDEIIKSLARTLNLIKESPGGGLEGVHVIRQQLESLLFGESIDDMSDWYHYVDQVKAHDPLVAEEVIRHVSK